VQLLGTGINLPAEIGKDTASVVPAACFEAGVPSSTLINQVAEEIRARGDPAKPWPLDVTDIERWSRHHETTQRCEMGLPVNAKKSLCVLHD
jgi:hypothetical protein